VTTDRNYNVSFESRVDFPFWNGLGKDEIRIQRCDKCLCWTWPAEWRCRQCGSWDLHWEAVQGAGVIYAWERTHYPFMPSFSDLLPYVNVLVELPHAGNRRLLGLLIGSVDSVRIGARVEAEIQRATPRTKNLPALFWRLAGTSASR
jgi:uncharacterized OB-fold protein